MTYQGKGRLSTGLPVTKGQLVYFRRITKSYNLDTQDFLRHLLGSTLRVHGRSPIPIDSRFIHHHFRQANLRDLRNDGLIEWLPHNQDAGLCRRFLLNPLTYWGFLAAGLEDAIGRPEWRTLDTEGLFRADALVMENAAPAVTIPPVLMRAFQSLKMGRCNLPEVLRHIQGLWDSAERAPSAELASANARAANDTRCLIHGVLPYRVGEDDGDVIAYQLRYVPQRTGRITQRQSGLQSCSRNMKRHAYAGIKGVLNVDLVASQIVGLDHMLRQEGIRCDLIEGIAQDPSVREILGRDCGLSAGGFKKVLLPFVFGGLLPHPSRVCKIPSSKLGAVPHSVLTDVGPERFEAVYEKVYDLLAPAEEATDYLVGRLIKRIEADGDTLVNACGMPAYFEKPSHRDKGEILAFFLQGYEALFIHTLTALGQEYGYEAISNEHDGLVVIGHVPAEAVEQARQATGISGLRLEEKPF